jgi:hypothetical protein
VIGIIQEIGKTSKQTPKIKVNGGWVYAGKLSIDGMIVGRTIEYFTSDFQVAPGKTIQMIESWAPAKDAPLTPQAPLPPRGMDEAHLRFCSNVVGSAISSGAIKAPADIGAWFCAAKGVVKEHGGE